MPPSPPPLPSEPSAPSPDAAPRGRPARLSARGQRERRERLVGERVRRGRLRSGRGVLLAIGLYLLVFAVGQILLAWMLARHNEPLLENPLLLSGLITLALAASFVLLAFWALNRPLPAFSIGLVLFLVPHLLLLALAREMFVPDPLRLVALFLLIRGLFTAWRDWRANRAAALAGEPVVDEPDVVPSADAAPADAEAD